MGDCGLTGRKIIVDTYGGMARHGGGAFQRQGPVEGRSLGRLRGALGGQERGRRRACADRAEVQVAYAIGVARPVSVMVETFGTENVDRRPRSPELVAEHFDLRPARSARSFGLHRPIYQKTAAYGHFGRDDPDFTWERTDQAAALPRLPDSAGAVAAEVSA